MPNTYTIPAAGISAAGFFTPTEFVDPAKPPAFLARHVDPATGEWVSILSGVHPVDDMVIRAFRVTENSGPAAIGVGNRFIDIKKIDETTARRLEYEVRRILKRMVSAGDLRIETLTVEADPDDVQASIFVEYTNIQSLQTTRLKVTATDTGVSVTTIQ